MRAEHLGADGVRPGGTGLQACAGHALPRHGAILVHDRPSRAPKVTIRGAFVDTVGGYELGGRGIWVGDQLVRTDRHGNFRATVRRGARISISLEDRGLPVDDVTLRRGDDTDVTLSTYYEDCH